MASKKKRTNRKPVKMNALYDGANIKRRFCPKCGAGVIMAEHENRHSCGKCGYSEFKK